MYSAEGLLPPSSESDQDRFTNKERRDNLSPEELVVDNIVAEFNVDPTTSTFRVDQNIDFDQVKEMVLEQLPRVLSQKDQDKKIDVNGNIVNGKLVSITVSLE